MRKENSIILILMMVLIMAFSPTAAYAEESIEPIYYDNLKGLTKQKADKLVQDYGATSVQYALISDGKIVLSGSAGVYSKTEDKLITSDTMYGIASVSKIFTTASVMKLVDEGKIDLDAPVTKYIEEFKMADDRYKKVTVRMLLNHSSGLMGSSFRNAFLFNDTDSFAKNTLLEQLSNQRLKAEPGAYSVYCNDGFTLAELVVEELSGMSFPEFIEINFTDPLGMINTKTSNSDFDYNQLAKTYAATFENPLPRDTVNIIGTGGIYSSAEDMCKFSQIFMNDSTKESKDIFSQETAKLTMEKEYMKGMWPQDHDSLLGFGLGWDHVNAFPFNQYEIQALVKGGDTMLYHSTMVVLPQYNMAMVVLSSSGVSTYNQTFAQSILLEALKLEGHIPEIKLAVANNPPVKADMPIRLLRYAGIYANSTMLMKVEITKDGALNISIPFMPSYPVQSMVYSDDGNFKNADGSSTLEFIKESNGKIYMKNSGHFDLPGLDQVASMEYIAQKIEDVTLSESVKAAWEKRNGKLYYVINEKYTSQTYSIAIPRAGVGFLDEAPGYLASDKIIDENNAVAFVEIPGTAGRDLLDYSFFTDGDKEYMKYNSTLLISKDCIGDIYAKGNAVCTIRKDGYARWFKVSAEDVGKTMTVEIPDKASFAVYDGNNICVNYSIITGENAIVIPQNGMIVFIGDANAKFNISFK